MRRVRRSRRVACALALVPATISMISPASAGAESWGSGFKADRARVAYGGSVKLSGTFKERYARIQPGEAGAAGTATYSSRPADDRPVAIQYRIPGVKNWKVVKRTRTGSEGRFRSALRLKRTGFVRAKLADGTVTRQRQVRVGSRLVARVVRRHLDSGGATRVSGRVKPGTAGRRVVVKVGKEKERTRTRSGGRFKVRMRLNGLGTRRVKVIAKSDRAAAGSKRRAGKVTSYRRAHASWYGPGFYGNRTACGQTLTTGMVGVAHKTLPCGTKLTFRYGSRVVRARVIDRGPYAAGREFDLTEALKNKLGFPSTGYVQVNK